MLTEKEIGQAIRPICNRYGINFAYLFGSYSRQESHQDSDVDLLIDTGEITGYIKLFEFKHDLENQLGVGVDVVTMGTITPDGLFEHEIERDAKLLYVSDSFDGEVPYGTSFAG